MTTKYFVNNEGKFVGAFGGVNPIYPQGLNEVPEPPEFGWDIWDFDTEQWLSGTKPIPNNVPLESHVQSPNGTVFKITVDNNGKLFTEEVT